MERARFTFADAVWFLVFAVGSTVWCLTAAAQLGATFDEPFYLHAGLEGWRTGSHHMLLQKGTMPLPADVATLPLYAYERWSGKTLDLEHGDFARYLFWARATTQVFWWLLLAFVCVVGRSLAGPWGGRLAVALTACEPTFLAHASLATTDIAAAALLLPTAYYFARGREATSWKRRIGVPALWFGLALFAKASALVFAPLGWLFIEVHRLTESGALRPATPSATAIAALCARIRQAWTAFGPFRRDVWRAGWLGLVIVFVLCGCDWTNRPSLVRWATALPDETTGKASLVWLAENLRIFDNAGAGLVKQVTHSLRGHPTYLLGETSVKSIPGYFPIALSIKLPLPILFLPLILAAVRPRALWNWACLAAAGFLLYSLTCGVQNGVRLMLPWVALGIAGLSAALVRAVGEAPQLAVRRMLVGVAACGVVWLGASSTRIWPHGLCFINELWGGPREGYKLISDANYDWGQGLTELARWQQENDAKNLDVLYFGTDPLLDKLPMQRLNIYELTPENLSVRTAGRRLAVNTTLLYGGYAPQFGPMFDRLRRLEPADRTTTFLIYDFTKTDLQALSDAPLRR
jgi:hypothetical protein